MENQEVQEIRNKKRFLKRYKNNVACVRRLEAKLNLLDDKIKSVKSPSYSGMPRGGTPIALEDLLSDKFDLEQRIKRLKAKNKKIKDQILEEIDTLEDSRYSEVLELFCIDCKSISDIGHTMGYSDRYIYDLYREAVYKLTFTDSV